MVRNCSDGLIRDALCSQEDNECIVILCGIRSAPSRVMGNPIEEINLRLLMA